ncbi:hypothetical protein HY285_00020 [Candidatus Peregrinibacteria bacterium]|nr:hypothetical protein [Candidatus Peregrinibacteria bacterium]MBI3815920.1 hypothetical protein [Candidatus Peregrinibacteria bacterium]
MVPLPTVTIELIPDPELGGFTAHVSSIPAYGEGETEEEAIADLKVGLQGYVEEYGIEQTLSRIIPSFAVRTLNLEELVHG